MVQYGGDDVAYVAVEAFGISDVVFDDSIFSFKWKNECYIDGNAVELAWYTTGTYDNDFVIDASTYDPDDSTTGSVGIPIYTGDVNPLDATIAASDTGMMPVVVTNNFVPDDSVSAIVWYDDTNLEYVGYETGGYACTGTLSVTTSTNNDTVYIDWPGHCDKSIGTDTLVWLKFRNDRSDSANVEYTDTVQVLSWRQVDCPSALASEASPAKAVVRTPEFTATISIKSRGYVEDRTDSLETQSINNHVIEMGYTAAQDLEERAATFHVLDSAFDRLSLYTTNCEGPAEEGELDYNWVEATSAPTGSRIFRQGTNSADIEIHSSAYTIAYLRMDTHEVGANAKVTADLYVITDTTEVNWYGEDFKVTARGRETTIYPEDVMDDDHLTIQDGIITVANIVPPSCPFVTVWNGRGFVEENTILTQSEHTAEGVSVTDFYPLENRPQLDKDGFYRIRIEEREDEVSYIDEIRLLRVYSDRPVGVTSDGEFFLTGQKLRPKTAVDHTGRDILEEVLGDDEVTYSSGTPGWILVSYLPEYDMNGSVFAGHVVAAKEPCKPDEKRAPIELVRIGSEPILFEVSYRQSGGEWIKLADSPPRDQNTPTFSRTDLDIRAGQRIEIKYEWTNRWVVDALPLVVAASVAPKPYELRPASAVHSLTGQSRQMVEKADNEFTVLKKGESLELAFPAGGRPNQSATPYFVIAAKGYYTPYAASDGEAQLPAVFALNPNYPNPFNASTQIAFALPIESEVEMGVFNVLGRKVKAVVSETMPAGEHIVTWDGTNDQGTAVASGTYFIRMRAGDFRDHRKMTLLK